MAEFQCRLGTPSGEVVNRVYEADVLSELKTRLEREGYRIFAITKQGKQTFSQRAAQKAISGEEFLIFNQQLAAMLRAGLPILQALNILIRRHPPGAFRTILEDVENRVRSGTVLSDAFAAHGEVFPRLYTASILAGERSGDLDNVLLRYVNYIKTLSDLRRKLKKTLVYPITLIIFSVGLVIFMTTVVIPKFASIYEGTAGQLPGITLAVVSISNGVKNNLTWLVPLVIIISGAITLWKRTEKGKLKIDEWLLKLPMIGELICQSTIAQLSRSLATLLAGGINLLEAFEIASESVTNRALRKTMIIAASRIRGGEPFTESLKDTNWVPPLALDMINVGERSGSLREMLDEVANFYDAELDLRLSTLTSLIEPVILVVMGAVVMTILLAMYLPILQLMRDPKNLGN